MHIDGARVFNAAIASGCEVKDIAKHADSLSFCLSKGLCCPIGSMVVGPKDFIENVRKLKKSIGGGWRQAGILAAAGIVALKEMVEPIKEDHEIAQYIGSELAKLPQLTVHLDALQANMIFFQAPSINPEALVKHLSSHFIRMNQPFEKGGDFRIACHHYIRKP